MRCNPIARAWGTLEPASFTIEFPEHLPRAKWQYCLDQLTSHGAQVQPESERAFRVVCEKPKPLAYVGWALFNTHFAQLCKVIATSGGAERRASAYPVPKN